MATINVTDAYQKEDMNFITNDDVFFKLRFLDQFMEEHKGFIAGGCFKNVFKKEKVKDIDIFFLNETDHKEAVKLFKAKKGFKKSYSNAKVNAFTHKKTGLVIELIKQTYGTPKEILSIFDFSITRFAYFKDKEGAYSMMYINTYFEHLVNNKLVIDGELKFPVSTFERSFRYKKYGFGLCRTSKEKLISALKTADIKNLSRDLYFGVD